MSRSRSAGEVPTNWRALVVIAALIVILAAAFALLSDKLTSEAVVVISVIQIGAAVLLLILALAGGKGPAIKRFKMLNDTDDDLDDVEVDIVNHGGQTISKVWETNRISARQPWEPPEDEIDITVSNDVIVRYVLRYNRSGSKTFHIDCPSHSGTTLHDIVESTATLSGTTLSTCANYREGVDNSGTPEGFGGVTCYPQTQSGG